MITTGFIQVNSSEFKDFHRHLRAVFRISAMRAAINMENPSSSSLPLNTQSLEHGFTNLFSALPAEYKPMITKLSIEGNRLFASSPHVLQSRLGTLAKVDFRGDAIWTQALNQKLIESMRDTPEVRALREAYNFKSLTKWLKATKLIKKTKLTNHATSTALPISHAKLSFKLESILCEDETDWDLGDDAISMGGMAIDSSTPQIKKIQEFQIKTNSGEDFKTGRRKDWNSDLTFVEFNLQNSNVWPRTFVATLLLFEKDLGGATAFLQTLWDGTKEQIIPLVTQLATAAVAGAVTGTVAGVSIGGPLGAVAGFIAGVAVSALVAVIIEMSKDDLIGDPENPLITFALLENQADLWPGNLTIGQTEFFDFKGSDALYRARGHWELS